MRADLKVYKDAVAVLDKNFGPGFRDAYKRAETARLAYEAAVERFTEHVDDHGCG
jgi:hypothetical protein